MQNKQEICQLNTELLRDILDSNDQLKKRVTEMFGGDRSVTYKILKGKRSVAIGEGLTIAKILLDAGKISSPFDLVS